MDQDREPSLTSNATADGVRTLTFNRPAKANALDADLVDRLLEEIARAEGEGREALVLRAVGKAFCGGFDFTGYEAASQGDLLLRFARIEEALQRLRRSSFVSVALIHGPAMGAGADIAASCAFRIGTPATRFRFPGFRFGVALGTRHLAQLVGAQKAREILLSNATVDAEEALRIGLLTHLVEPDMLDATAQQVLAGAKGLDQESRRRILGLTAPQDDDANLAELVRSVCAPGLSERIARYRSGH